MRIDLRGRDIQGIETVADERQVIQPLHRFSVRPDALGEPGTEEVVRHAPVDCTKKWERVNQRSAAWNAGVTSSEAKALVESPPYVAGYDDRRSPRRSPDGEAIAQPLVEDEA